MDYTVFAVSPSGETIYSNGSGDLFYLSDRGTYIPVRREEDIRKGLAVGSFDIVNKDEFDDAGNLSIGGYIVDPADCERVNPESSDVSAVSDEIYASKDVISSPTEETIADSNSQFEEVDLAPENTPLESAQGMGGSPLLSLSTKIAHETLSSMIGPFNTKKINKDLANSFFDANSNTENDTGSNKHNFNIKKINKDLANSFFGVNSNTEDVGGYVTDNFSSALQPTPENNTPSDNTNQSSSSNIENVSSNGGEWDFTADSEMQDALSNKLMDSADKFDGKVSMMYREIGNLSNLWVGEDYDAYCNATNGYKTALGDLSDSIRMYGKHFEKMADTTDELSSELIEIVETCTHRHAG